MKLLTWPTLTWFLAFLAAPLVLIMHLSLQSRGAYGVIEYTYNLQNYVRSFDPLYLQILENSFLMSVLTSFSCFLIGFPVALAVSLATPQKRNLFIFLLTVPSLTNLVIRVYAIKVFAGYDGPLAFFLQACGFDIDPMSLTYNPYLVFYGLVTTYIPFMIFPIFASLEKFDFSLVEAAQDLGASPTRILFKILIPGTWPAILSGLILVFIPCLGEYVIPDLLGGAKTQLVGNLITEQFLKTRDWPFGAALSVLMIVILMLSLWLINKTERKKAA